MVYTRPNRGRVNINPLQAGGILTEDARKALVEFGDGYSVCDYCGGRLDEIDEPPIRKFVHEQLPKFLGCDVARITGGAREGIFAILHAITKPGDTIILDGNKHYSTVVAAERAGLKIINVPSSGTPDYKINVKDYEALIREHKPAVVLLTYPDGSYGNLANARALGDIALRNNVPYIVNGAYAVGRMPIDMRGLGADFIVGSGHKSMASSGPIGVIGMSKKWEDKVLVPSGCYKNKEVEMLGCTARGASIMTMMASFPHVKERVTKWKEQVEKARWFSQEMEKLGITQLGEKPHNHDLMFFESPRLYEISQNDKRGRYFLYEALKENNFWGIKTGLTKQFKISTFAASKEDLERLLGVFKKLLQK